ncbi:MAG: helix-turn-helix transcriptional regulator [Clostridia bacterium]|nr:helix-turn-helix transcriptional regulator [Clostridia bacterium]
MHFYQRLMDMREDHDKTQSEIAAVLNVTQQQYSRWESGMYQKPIESYKILAVYYNASLDCLTGLVDTPRKLNQ